MMESTADSLVGALRSDLGDDLRLVGRYDESDLEVLYVRDDVGERRSAADYEELHEQVLDDHRERSRLENLDVGRLQTNLLAFEEVLGANFLTDEATTGYLTTLDRDANVDLRQFLRRYDTATTAVRTFQAIRFEHPPAERDCPRCGSFRTISTPEAGPGAPFHCLGCDSSFSWN